MTAKAGIHIHYTYGQVLAALRIVEPATTFQVFDQLEGGVQKNTMPVRKRRRWVWQALMNMARDGVVDYVIEREHVYYWRIKP
jgi:hypothetical protein